MNKQNKVAFFNILSTVLLYGISIFTAPLFSRLLGTSGYGIVSIYAVWTNVASILFSLQTSGTLVNARVEYSEEEQPKYQSSVMTLSLLAYLGFSVLVLLFSDFISQWLKIDTILVVLILLHGFGASCVTFLNAKFTYEFKAGKNFAMSMGTTLSTLVLSLLLIWLLPDETEYYGRILAMAGTYTVLGIAICGYILLTGKTFYNRKYWKLCIPLALPMVFSNLSYLVLGQSDRVMIQQMLDESMVGQYSLAYNFGSIMLTVFTALNNSWVPFFFEDMKQDRQDAIQKQAKNFLELYTVLSVGFVLLATEVYHVFASEEFWPGTVLIPIFVASQYMNFLCTFSVNYEYYHKQTKIVAAVTVVSAVINVILNYFLIKAMGVAGAAMATALSHGLQFAIHYVYTRYVLGKGDYPFGAKLWLKYPIIFFAFVAFVLLMPEQGLLRWGIGAAIGVWELWRIKQRKVLI